MHDSPARSPRKILGCSAGKWMMLPCHEHPITSACKAHTFSQYVRLEVAANLSEQQAIPVWYLPIPRPQVLQPYTPQPSTPKPYLKGAPELELLFDPPNSPSLPGLRDRVAMWSTLRPEFQTEGSFLSG